MQLHKFMHFRIGACGQQRLQYVARNLQPIPCAACLHSRPHAHCRPFLSTLMCVQQMKRQADKKQTWLQQGHGEYHFIPNEKEFFASMKGEERMVCHFFRDNWPCKVIDKHMQILCKKHLECKFIKVRLFLLAQTAQDSWQALPQVLRRLVMARTR